ncbi:hypothetical protein CBM2589_B220006 [Cupriavidus taiwanensis]|uniref:Uncharacterized protein n=1 Tax=Cupriavidus taiwanensis TaxID=164546 RepID=A0A375BNI9_9BURK|nr:hypothetical protein CBM2589_B220006 [Cupriavidus taiwanensis]
MWRTGHLMDVLAERLATLKVYGRVHFPACRWSDPSVTPIDDIDTGASGRPQQEFSCTAVTA